MKDLDFYENLEDHMYRIPEAWLIVGLPVAAKFSDNIWHRGIILELKHVTEEATVSFVDYGGSMRVPLENLRLLKREFFKQPAFAIRVSLVGVLPTNANGVWANKAQDLMLSFSRDPEQPLACAFYKKAPQINRDRQYRTMPPIFRDVRYEVELCDTMGDKDLFISEILIDQRLAMKCKKKQMKQMLEGVATDEDVLSAMYAKIRLTETAASG